MTPAVVDLRTAPELAVLHALDATIVAADRALQAEHPTLHHESMSDGNGLPVLRAANTLSDLLGDLRRALRAYRTAVYCRRSAPVGDDFPF